MSTNNQPPSELNRVLVVDDETIVLTALRETLRLEGYEVVAVADPVEALSLIQRQAFSVIITDQQMPALTGLEFLAQAKHIQPNATRILITALLSLSTVIDAINKGEIYRFIVKPWLREELLVTIKNAVQRYELICRNAALHQQTLAINEQLSTQLARVDEQNRQLDRLNQALQRNLDQSIQLCLKTMETFYPVLGSQARRVHALCRAMAESLQLTPDQRHVLEISARLHDVGLVGTPRELIRKWLKSPESLTDAERSLVELHPVLGQELVAFVADLEAVGTTIRAHHERFDGHGYPDKLEGEGIPWLARLLAVAVAYASVPNGGQVAVEMVKSGSGTVFDPDAVRAFLRSLPQAVVPRNQQEVLLTELKPGMVLARGIYTGNGMLLVPEGQVLNEPHINMLYNHNRLTPITQSLFVYC
jgi:response regulator RpfG family c-di-GMP phosphodiesterase